MKKVLNKKFKVLVINLIFILICSIAIGTIFGFTRVDNRSDIIIGSKYSYDYNIALKGALEASLSEQGYRFNNITIKAYNSDAEIMEAIANEEVAIGLVETLDYIEYEKINTHVMAAIKQHVNYNGEEIYMTSYYNTILLAAYNEKTKALKDKPLTFKALNELNVCVQKPTSMMGYLYVEKYLSNNFNHHINELANAYRKDSYYDAFMALSDGTCDVISAYNGIIDDYGDEFVLENEFDSIENRVFVLETLHNFYSSIVIVKNNREKPIYDMLDMIFEDLSVDDGKMISSFNLISDNDIAEAIEIRQSIINK